MTLNALETCKEIETWRNGIESDIKISCRNKTN